ncbi:hypothetical protein [Spirosoma oryzicola]|uniref:hypothetical protein n=1 Tax=Spirosoma oryzicola TaxID=2898794 RepID=UPI001E3616C0|nr:hypothetical protein [Spirosoma oryzicola]UHG93284.1 hypothetical protein LQ777_10365 [Spirosoma oryzicola]
MDKLIDFLGRDTFIIAVLFIAVNIRAGKPEKVPILDGLTLSFTPFFVVLCLLYLFEFGLGLFGLELPAKVLGATAGVFGYLGNSWLVGLAKNGERIEEGGSLEALAGLIKSVINFFKKTD